MEEIALEWLRDLLGMPASTGAGFVTGATMANFTCLAAARHALLERTGWNVEDDGLFGAPAITVVVGDEVHVSRTESSFDVGAGQVARSVPVDRRAA